MYVKKKEMSIWWMQVDVRCWKQFSEILAMEKILSGCRRFSKEMFLRKKPAEDCRCLKRKCRNLQKKMNFLKPALRKIFRILKKNSDYSNQIWDVIEFGNRWEQKKLGVIGESVQGSETKVLMLWYHDNRVTEIQPRTEQRRKNREERIEEEALPHTPTYEGGLLYIKSLQLLEGSYQFPTTWTICYNLLTRWLNWL